ncbi:Teichoic acid translocation permease protein TagG [compost metagenome]
MLLGFLRDTVRLKGVILELAKRDYQQINQGSYLGFIWNYLQPLLYIGVLYAVFTLGFRQGATQDGLPFGLYLLSGMICWLYFAGNLSSITGVIRDYGFLVKKVDFRLSVLPFVKLLSSLLPHILLLALLLIAAELSGIRLGLHTLQLIYYFLCMASLLVGLGWISSSASLFIPDIRNLVSIITQFGLWVTPIFWSVSQVPQSYQWLTGLNPVSYLVTGYRDSLTGARYFWERPQESLLFWGITLILLAVGTLVYRRLKPHFAEVV